jgi:hypothetical protein
MVASYAKLDANCKSEILFIGSTGLRGPSPSVQYDAELYIDVIAAAGYDRVEFDNVNLILEIIGPGGAKFVYSPSLQNKVRWGVHDPVDSWVESADHPPTSRLRLRNPHDVLLRGSSDGLSFWVGLSGLAGSTFSFTASATADRVLAGTAGCAIQFKDLAIGEQLKGYHG